MKSLFLRFAKDPTKTDLIFKISDLGRDLKKNSELIHEIEREILSIDSFREAWDERWMPPTPTMEKLTNFPEGTLGQAYFNHLKSNELDINFYLYVVRTFETKQAHF